MKLRRREFLRLSGVGTFFVAASGLTGCRPSVQLSPETMQDQVSRLSTIDTPIPQGEDVSPVEISIKAVEEQVPILDGQMTSVWRYVGEVVAGDPHLLREVPNSYLGPTFQVQQGQRIRVTFTNELPVPSGIHWHGLLVPERMDGHPQDQVAPGESYVYDFVVQNRAGTYWYHPHPDRTTGGQVYRGLAGLFLVSDREEAVLTLPRNEQDIGLVLQDRVFDEAGQLVYGGNDPVQGAQDAGFYGNGHTQSMGMTGNRILANGQLDYVVDTETTTHRIRILNGSNARTYVLAWSDQRSLTVIGTDGGLLEASVQRPYMILAPGERVELWADFSAQAAESELALVSYSMSGGDPFLLTRFIFHESSSPALQLPALLTKFAPLTVADTINGETPRRFQLGATQAGWTINGRPFELEATADDERVQLHTAEVWEFVNDGSGGGMLMGHPMHIHGVQFRVIERTMEGADPQNWASIQAGYVDEGWKDTVNIMAGERVQLLMRFEAHAGLFLMHCHFLEHEDFSMMRNFLIET